MAKGKKRRTRADQSRSGEKPSVSEPPCHDVFISYSSEDKAWVRGELLEAHRAGRPESLHRLPRLHPRCTEHQGDGARCPDVPKTLLVLTPDYIESEWCEIENIMAQTLSSGQPRPSSHPAAQDRMQEAAPHCGRSPTSTSPTARTSTSPGGSFSPRLGAPPSPGAAEGAAARSVVPGPSLSHAAQLHRARRRAGDAHPLAGHGRRASAAGPARAGRLRQERPRLALAHARRGPRRTGRASSGGASTKATPASTTSWPRRWITSAAERSSPTRSVRASNWTMLLATAPSTRHAARPGRLRARAPRLRRTGRRVSRRRSRQSPRPTTATASLRSPRSSSVNVATLPNIRAKVLLTTRLCPRVLEAKGGGFLQGCREEELKQMQPADAVEFFHAQGIRGTHTEIEAACAALRLSSAQPAPAGRLDRGRSSSNPATSPPPSGWT